VQPSGARSWHLRFWHQGKGHNLHLGSVLDEEGSRTEEPAIGAPLTVADARMLAIRVLHDIKHGRDPGSLVRRVAAEGTVADVIDRHIKLAVAKLRTAAERKYDLGLIRASLGRRPMAEVKRSDLARLRDRIEERNGPRAADRVLGTWSAMAAWWEARSDDYSAPSIRKLRIKRQARERVLTDSELRAIWRAAEALGFPYGAFVKLLLLTAARRREVAGMKRSELSDDGAVWTLPSARTKAQRDVVLPLSRAAQAVIAGATVIAPGDMVLTTDGTRAISGFAYIKRLVDRESGVSGWRLHDLRRTSRTLLSRAGVSTDVAERCLGHAIGGVRGVYDRHRYLQEMAEAFEALAAMIGRVVG
jgi:integrase